MVNSVLKAAGIPFRRARFLKPPAGTYAVYTDDIETDGGDGLVAWYHHNITVELYEPTPDDKAEQRIENELAAEGVQFDKQDRYWLQSEQRYQVIYEFAYIEKRRF